MSSWKVTWEGRAQVDRNMRAYGMEARTALTVLLRSWEAQIENYAKQYAPWTDRTANARQNLFTFTSYEGDSIRLYLCHRVEYGFWLEVRWAGRYAIIKPTLEHFQGIIMASVQRIFKN